MTLANLTTNIPFLSFFKRYWIPFFFAVAGVVLCLWSKAFETFGTLIYIFGVFNLVVVQSWLIRHLLFRRTIEADLTDGIPAKTEGLIITPEIPCTYVKNWQELTAVQRQQLTAAYTIAILIAAAIVAAGVSH